MKLSQVAKKLHHDAFPATPQYSDKSRLENASHLVNRMSAYKVPSNPDDEVPAQLRATGFRVRAAWKNP